MSDITMCLGTNCPLKNECYRFTAKPNPYYQSFFVETPVKNGQCEQFVPTEKQ